jgi:L-alanine-DL-glutamate epimerase-like enolase superfamily enzyme
VIPGGPVVGRDDEQPTRGAPAPGNAGARLHIVDVRVEALSVPLVEPFVIASGRMDATRAALVDVVVEDRRGRTGRGLGEAAALPPVTRVDQPALLASLSSALPGLLRATFAGLGDLVDLVDGLRLEPVARAAVESALLFAWADVLGVPLHRLLGTSRVDDPVGDFVVETDITIPIAEPAHMADLVVQWRARGFRSFKVKVGRDAALGGADADAEALARIARSSPQARLRIDGNAGQSLDEALALFRHALALGLVVELVEQPLPADDIVGLAQLSTRLPVPVVADESAVDLASAAALADAGVTGLNLKLVKHGGPLAAARIGRFARRRRLALMTGAMVETRVGLAAMLHVARALTPWGTPPPAIDLDTALLLAADPFTAGYLVDGPRLRLLDDGPRRR